MPKTRVLIPSGVLGLGFDAAALQRAVQLKPDIICIDGGSTDSGPYSLGTGTSKYSRAACKAEWRQLLQARAELDVPLVIGSCGTCGTRSTVDWMLEITTELAGELDQQLCIATLYSDQQATTLATAYQSGDLVPLEPAPRIDENTLDACTNIVALAGIEQINAALATGADVVLAGRASDAAVIAALPIQRGCHAGAAWHGAKVAECGALCSTNPTSGVILLDVDDTGFEVQPMADDAQCTPHSVSAHMLYENADPVRLAEPGGTLDVSVAHYTAISESRVRVEGSKWLPANRYTVKLEGAHIAGYQSTLLAMLRERHYVRNAKQWVSQLEAFLHDEIAKREAATAADYTLEFRLVGMDSVLGELETGEAVPNEVGVLCTVTATDNALAKELAKLVNPFLLHYPLTSNEDLPTFAFPYSPAQSDRGALYEFSLNHALVITDPMSAFELQVHGSTQH